MADLTSRARTALLTLGRLPVALTLARALHVNGYRVLVAETLPVHLCRVSRAVSGHRKVRAPIDDAAGYLADLVDIVERDAVDIVVPVSEEALHVAALRDLVSVRVLGVEQATLVRLHDKLDSARLFASLGLAVADTEPLDEHAAIWRTHDWIVKPRHGCSGSGVVAGKRGVAPTLTSNAVLQRFVPGAELCSFSIALDGRPLLTLAYRSLLDAGSVSVRFEAVAVPDAVQRIVDTTCAATGFSGPIAFDFRQDQDGTWLPIECNPRATSGIHVLTHAECAALVAAWTDPDGVAPHIEPASLLGRRRQEYRSCLLALEVALLHGRIDRQGWRELFTVPDLCWHRRDPLPALAMTPASLPLLWRALRAREPITRIAMRDMGWSADHAHG